MSSLKHQFGLIGALQDGWAGQGAAKKLDEQLLHYTRYFAEQIEKLAHGFVEQHMLVRANTNGSVSLEWPRGMNGWGLDITFISEDGKYEMYYKGEVPADWGKLEGTTHLTPNFFVQWMRLADNMWNEREFNEFKRIAEKAVPGYDEV